MTDQVNRLPSLVPPFRQLGFPGAPCGGRSCCTDSVGAEIVRAETGRTITLAAFRAAARPGDPTPCGGLTPGQFLRGLRAFGVKGYDYVPNVTASDVLKATDRGIVLTGVGYYAYPTRAECEIGGKTDLPFRGAHAIAVFGRRFRDGRWICWVRDPDHHWDGRDADGTPAPPYDRFETRYLARAIRALIGVSTPVGTWTTTFMVAKSD